MFFVSTDQSTPTLSDVMVFLTGCDCVPPMGFSDVSPAVMFSDDTGALPKVSTCSLTLTFPRTFPTDIQLFNEMDFAILGSQGFFGSV